LVEENFDAPPMTADEVAEQAAADVQPAARKPTAKKSSQEAEARI